MRYLAALATAAGLFILAPVLLLTAALASVFVPGLALFRRTSDPFTLNIASFHSPHSLTWSWVLSFIRPRAADEGRWLGLHGYRTNTGWTVFLQIARCQFHLSRQRPMLFRSLYHRARDLGAGFLLLALIALAGAALSPSIALAQSGPIEAPSLLADIWSVVSPLVVMAVSTIGPVLIGWLAFKLAALLNIQDAAKRQEMEVRLRDALHQSALNGAKMAAARFGLPELGRLTAASPVVQDAVAYVRSHNPEALEAFGLDGSSGSDLADIVLSKVHDLIEARR